MFEFILIIIRNFNLNQEFTYQLSIKYELNFLFFTLQNLKVSFMIILFYFSFYNKFYLI